MTVEERTREVHPLTLFAPEGARLLLLGSFPPPRERWRMDFFYPNSQNDMWRIFGLVFFGDKAHFLTVDGRGFRESAIRAFLTERGIAIWDTAMEVSRLRGNASDKFLEVLRPIDLRETLSQLPACRAIAVTGQKALDTLLTLVAAPSTPKTGQWIDATLDDRHFRLYRMPSSSRAYPLSVEKKAEKYAQMFEVLGMK